MRHIVQRTPVSIPRRPPAPPVRPATAAARPRGAATAGPRRPLGRRVMLAVLWLEAAAWLGVVGLRLREMLGVATDDLRVVIDAGTAVGVFLVVRLWSLRADAMPAALRAPWWARLAHRLSGAKAAGGSERAARAPRAQRLNPYQGFGRGTLAATLFWLGPALSARGWASVGEAAPVAAFVFAVFAGSRECWLAAGLIAGAGFALDPQFAWVAPLFVLWPLFTNAPRATARVVIGAVTAVALAASRELIGGGALWVTGVALAPLLLRRDWPGRFGRPLLSIWIAVPLAIELLGWPVILPGARAWPPIVALGVVAVIVLASGLRLAGRRWIACQVGLAASAALFACPLVFGGSYDALVRLLAGVSHDPASRVAGVLEQFARLAPGREIGLIDFPAFYLRHAVTVGDLMVTGYALVLIVAAAGAARRSVAGHPGTLVALALPWVAASALIDPSPTAVARACCATALCVAAGAGLTAWQILLASGVVVLMGQASGWI